LLKSKELIMKYILARFGFMQALALTVAGERNIRSGRKLDGITYRTDTIDPSELKCQIRPEQATNNSTVQNFDVPFYYALGFSGQISSMDMLSIQQELFLSIYESITWCWKASLNGASSPSAVVANRSSTVQGLASIFQSVGGRLLGRSNRRHNNRGLVQFERDLGIISVGAGPGVQNVGTCM
jgi:hypothetical protein